MLFSDSSGVQDSEASRTLYCSEDSAHSSAASCRFKYLPGSSCNSSLMLSMSVTSVVPSPCEHGQDASFATLYLYGGVCPPRGGITPWQAPSSTTGSGSQPQLMNLAIANWRYRDILLREKCRNLPHKGCRHACGSSGVRAVHAQASPATNPLPTGSEPPIAEISMYVRESHA